LKVGILHESEEAIQKLDVSKLDPDAEAKDSHLQIREGVDYSKGIEIFCANKNCSTDDSSGQKSPAMSYPSRFLAVVFPDSRVYLKCARCKKINRIYVQTVSSYTVEVLDGVRFCPTEGF
jgi:phage FluMu protein Com